jgi:hypothetical protein
MRKKRSPSTPRRPRNPVALALRSIRPQRKPSAKTYTRKGRARRQGGFSFAQTPADRNAAEGCPTAAPFAQPLFRAQ